MADVTVQQQQRQVRQQQQAIRSHSHSSAILPDMPLRQDLGRGLSVAEGLGSSQADPALHEHNEDFDNMTDDNSDELPYEEEGDATLVKRQLTMFVVNDTTTPREQHLHHDTVDTSRPEKLGDTFKSAADNVDKLVGNITADTTAEDATRKALVDVFCGSAAGVIGKLVEHPWDTIKVRLQTQSLLVDSIKPGVGADTATVASGGKLFAGPWDCFKKTLKVEGVRGLYQGLPSPLVGAMMENAVLFLTYNQIQKFIKASTSSSSPGGTFTDDTPLTIGQLSIAGALSGACVSLILTPVELIKCQMQVQELQMGAYGISPKASAAANAVPKSAVPAAATASSGNTRIRSMMPGDGGHGTRRWFNSFVGFPASTSNMAGGVSIARTSAISRVFSPLSIFAQSSFQPFVRSPTAASTGAHNVPKAAVAPAEAAAPPRQSSLATLFNIVREHGVRGLYRGTTWTLVRETGGGAAWFGVYEGTCRLMLNHDLIIDRYIQGNTGYAAAAAHHQQAKWVEDKRQLKPWQLAAAGGLAGVAFNASFFPADVLKSIYQTRSHSELEAMLSSNGMKPTASSSSLFGRMLGNRTRVFRGLCADVYRREGIRGFYNGMGITLARAIPSNAVIFLTYEMLSRHFEGK